MLVKEIKYSYNDISITPHRTTVIEHREDCNPFDDNGFLPIFTAPMSSVVDENNFNIFEENKIYPILPRSCDIKIRLEYSMEGKWASFSLSEFELYFCDESNVEHYNNFDKKALIDVANGHMEKIYKLVRKAKKIHGNNLKVMIGNIANPLTYYDVYSCGADYVRVGIGGGSCCITSSNTAVHYPQASLVSEMAEVKNNIKKTYCLNDEDLPKIIADGGIRNYSDVIKALALGADYVMIGGLFGSLIESCGKMYTKTHDGNTIFINRNDYDSIKEEDNMFVLVNEHDKTVIDNLYKVIYGMASKQGQIDIDGEKHKTSEGIIKEIKVTTNLNKWVDNMIAYLRSAMSYISVNKVCQMKFAKCILISDNAKNSINK